MLDITSRNVNYLYPEALWKMKTMGVEATSRNGKVRRFAGPVASTYTHPTERMLFDQRRDANPFFHIFEGTWMLAGRNDVWFLGLFNSSIANYSDDGKIFHGAYGYRWRHHFGCDQLHWLIDHLRTCPDSRRAVIQMFDPTVDQHMFADSSPKDIPCNTAIYFEICEGVLNMSVTCRSNDMVWGCYGANVVHMSMLQEFVANALGVPVGQYVQFSNNLHIYERHFDLMDGIEEAVMFPYETHNTHVAIARTDSYESDLRELEDWSSFYPQGWEYTNPFILRVLAPMLVVWGYYKQNKRAESLEACLLIKDLEVQAACSGWLKRRKWRVGA